MLAVLASLLVLLQAPPQAFQSRIEAGIAALDRNDLTSAQSNFEQAARVAPRQPGVWMLLAQTYARQQRMPLALTAAQKAALYAGSDAEILRGLAAFYASAAHDLPKAAAFGAKYAALASEDRTAWRRVADLYLAAGQPAEAVAAAERGLAIDPGPEIHTVMGQAYAQLKKWNEAESELQKAVQLNPYDEAAHFRLAQIELLQQKYSDAVRVLQAARKVYDRSPQLELTLGVAFYGQRKFGEAVDQFLKTAQLNPDLPQPYAFLSRVLEHAGPRLPDVIRQCEIYEQRNPKSYLGYLLHANALIQQMQGSPEADALAARAQELLTQSLQLEQRDSKSHALMGQLLERKKDYAGAARELEKSVELDPKDSAARFRLARVYERLGRKEDAAAQRALHEKLVEAEQASPAALPTVVSPSK